MDSTLTTPPAVKQCKLCGREKPIDSFLKRRGASIHYVATCRECTNATARRRYEAAKRDPPVVPRTKTCLACGVEKLSSEFYAVPSKPDGLMGSCKACKTAYEMSRYHEQVAIGMEEHLPPADVPAGFKQCRGCGLVKPISGFFRHVRMADGRLNFCRTCHGARNVARERAGRQRRREEYEEAHRRTCVLCSQTFPATAEYFYQSRDPERSLDPSCRLCIDQFAMMTWRSGANRPPTYAKIQDARWRLNALQHYGGSVPQCACCGETQLLFLSIDHIHGGGSAERRRLGISGSTFHAWLKKQGWPDGYRVLCYNCNLAYGFYGRCPHQTPAVAIT